MLNVEFWMKEQTELLDMDIRRLLCCKK